MKPAVRQGGLQQCGTDTSTVKRGIDEQGGQIPKLSNENHTSRAAIDRSEQVDALRRLGEPEREGLIDLVQ
jgi:hypothetical protein